MRSPLQRRTNMSYEQITQYYQDYQHHSATLKETCDRIAIHICRNPYLFRQYTLSEDSRSSFLLYLCENLPDIIRKYDSSRSSFATYFSRTVFYYFCTEFRKTRIEGYQEHALYPDIYYENQLTAEDTHDYTTSECTLPVTTRLKRQVLPKRYQLMLLILVLKTASFPTKTIMEQLLTNGTAPSPYIGITGTDISEENASIYRLPVGALVIEVEENSPAAKAGIQQGDVITEFDGKSVLTIQSLVDEIATHSVGDEVSVHLVRNGKEAVDVTLTIGDRNAQ